MMLGLSDLLIELEHSDTIIWFEAHADDELFTGGTFGYFTRDLHGRLIIVPSTIILSL